MSAQGRALVYVLVVFFCGAIAGALVMNVAEHYWLHPRPAAAAENWGDIGERRSAIELFKQQLNLTPDQTKQLEGILDETMIQYEDLHTFTHHIRDNGLLQIRAMLNEDQRKKFDELTRRIETPEQRRTRKAKEQQEQQQQRQK